MPTYEYECERCSKKFEVNKPTAEAGKCVSCPSCGSARTSRHWSVTIIKSTGLLIPNPDLSTGILARHGGRVSVENSEFENLDTAIHVEDGQVKGQNILLRGNKKGIVARRSKVDIQGLDIQ